MRKNNLHIVVSVLVLAFIMTIIIGLLKILVWLLPILFVIIIAAFVFFQLSWHTNHPMTHGKSTASKKTTHRGNRKSERIAKKLHDIPEAEIIHKTGKDEK